MLNRYKIACALLGIIFIVVLFEGHKIKEWRDATNLQLYNQDEKIKYQETQLS